MRVSKDRAGRMMVFGILALPQSTFQASILAITAVHLTKSISSHST